MQSWFEQNLSRLSNTKLRGIILLLILLHLVVGIRLHMVQHLTGQDARLDFDAYVLTTKAMLHGTNPYDTQYMVSAGPPFMYAFFIPFAVIPSLPMARALFSIASLGASLWATWIWAGWLYKETSITRKVSIWLSLHLALWLTFPTRFTFELGQTNLLLLPVLSVILESNKKWVQSVLFSVLVVGKAHFITTLLAFLPKPKVFFLAFLCLFITLLSLLSFVRPNAYAKYVSTQFPHGFFSSQTESAKSLDYYNQSLKSTLQRIGFPQGDKVLFVSTLLILSMPAILKGRKDLAFLMGLLAAPIFWQHYAVFMFPLLLYGVSHTPLEISMRSKLWLLLCVIGLSINIPWLHAAPVTQWNGILASHVFIASWGIAIWLLKHKITMQENKEVYVNPSFHG